MLDLMFFLGTVVAISLSGVLVPGPVFAVTVAKGMENKNAGVYIALGHGIVEIPLIAFLYIGSARLFNTESVMDLVGLIGGVALIYLGVDLWRNRRNIGGSKSKVEKGSFMGGIITSAANPYFFLWWATVGLSLLLKSLKFGLIGIALFVSVHFSCDFGWALFLSRSASGAERVLGSKLRKVIFIVSSVIMVSFGGWFIISGLGII